MKRSVAVLSVVLFTWADAAEDDETTAPDQSEKAVSLVTAVSLMEDAALYMKRLQECTMGRTQDDVVALKACI